MNPQATPHATADFLMSDGAAIGFLWDVPTRVAVSQLIMESRAPLPEGNEKAAAWLRLTQRQTAALAECARWVCVPARRAGDRPVSLRQAFVAGLTLHDALALSYGMAALHCGRTPAEARGAYAAARPAVPVVAAVDCLPLAALAANPERLFAR